MRTSCLLIVLVIVSQVAACDTRATEPREHFTARGRVTAVSAKAVEIRHEALPSVRTFDGKLAPMMSMVMPFAPSPRATIGGLAVDDIVQFDFTIHYDADPTLRLIRIEKLPPSTVLTLP